MKSLIRFLRIFTTGSSLFQYLSVFTGGLNLVSSGMHFGWPSPSLPKLLDGDSQIPITSSEGSWIVVTLLLGAFCGSLLAGTLSNKIGRKNVVLVAALPCFASWFMLAYADSVVVFIAARFVGGISSGLVLCTFPMYVGEISDPKIRGSLGCLVTVMWLAGMPLMDVMGSFFSIKVAALVSSVVPVLLLMTFPWMPESPYYFVMKGDLEQARRSLQVLKRQPDVDQELDRLKVAVDNQLRNTGEFSDLFTVKCNRRALLVAKGAGTAQQCSGTTAIMFYAQVIFKKSRQSISPTVASAAYFAVQLMISGISSATVDKVGRKPLMIVSIVGSGLALLVAGCHFYLHSATDADNSDNHLVPIVALIAYVIVFSLGMRTVPILLIGEVFSTSVKASASSLCNCYFFVVTALVSKFFQVAKDEFGMHVPFFAFAACCVLGLLFIILYVPETKGKTLEQIQNELEGKPADSETTNNHDRFHKTDEP